LAWIKAFGTTEVARFVYGSWLSTGGQCDLIDHHVLAWIRTFGETEHASFVYRAWLDAGGQRDLIDPYMLAWINAFGMLEDASFVYKAWLHAGGAFEAISDACLNWFSQNFTSPAAGYILKYISDQKELPLQTLHAVIRWCAHYAKDEDAIWRIAATLGRHARSSEGVALVRTLLLVLRYFDLERLRAPSSGEGIQTSYQVGPLLSHVVLSTIGRAILVRGLDEKDRLDLAMAHARLLLESPIYFSACVASQPTPFPSLIHHVAEMLESGVLDARRDDIALGRFADWMRAWPRDRTEELDLAVSRLRDVAPSDLWNGIPASEVVIREVWV